MDTNNMEYFVKICETNNITKAAKELFISQPALSRIVKKLEMEVGADLLIRGSHSLQLTPAGKCFLEVCEKFMIQKQQMFTDIQFLTGSRGSHEIGN